MALKDWRKFGKDTWVKPGRDRKNPHLLGGEVVSVIPHTGEWINGKHIIKKLYFVEIDESGYSKSKKTFKTKASALKFAKAYMRKH